MSSKKKRNAAVDPRQMQLHLIGDYRGLEHLAMIDAQNKRVTWIWVPSLNYDVLYEERPAA